MKDPQQEADELIKKYNRNHVILIKNTKGKLYSPYKSGYAYSTVKESQAVRCALTDNQNTIDTLEKVRNKNGKRLIFCVALVDEVAHHNQVRTILKSRLK